MAPAREQVYCHECQEEWYRDEGGLVCPNERCRSDFVEIIERNNDPRGIPELLDFSGDEDTDDEHDRHHHDHHHHAHHAHHSFFPPPFGARSQSPGGGTTVIRAEGPGYTYVTARTTFGSPRGSSRSPGGMAEDEVIADLFSTMLRNIVGDQYHPRSRPPGNPESPRSQEGGENHREGHTGGGEDPHSNHPPFGARLNPRNADSSQAGDTQVPDIHTFLASLFGPPAGDDQLPPALARLFGVPPGAGGDYVYSQAELDRIVSQLMEQHQGNAPPPAAKEDIEALPKVRVTEQMVNEGIDCAVCKEDLMLDEQVTTLPCHHSYHFDCVSKWLEAHDTCPICRHPITPEERRRQPPAQPASPTTSSGIPLAGLPFVGLFGPGGSRWAPMSSGPPRDANQPPNDTGTGTEQPGSTEQGGSGANNNTTGSNQAPNSGSGAAGRSTFASLFRRRGS